ncbi:transglycosylase family protein [Umezawaea sp. NPDC059074]|uniref:transglycosylase family protein n=1 Tax=Umezawaea sp. NPDC059074 TaxID=3346716 RepID=UPI00369A712A
MAEQSPLVRLASVRLRQPETATGRGRTGDGATPLVGRATDGAGMGFGAASDFRTLWRVLRFVAVAAAGVATLLLLGGTASARPGASGDWDAPGRCEGEELWTADTGYGFHEGLQFSAGTWSAFDGAGSPHLSSREDQVRIAERVLGSPEFDAWPSCTSRLPLAEAIPPAAPPLAVDDDAEPPSRPAPCGSVLEVEGPVSPV